MAQNSPPPYGDQDSTSSVAGKFGDVLSTTARGLQNHPAYLLIFGGFIGLLLFLATLGAGYVSDPILKFVLIGGAFLIVVIAAVVLFQLQNRKEQNMLRIRSLYEAAREAKPPKTKKGKRKGA